MKTRTGILLAIMMIVSVAAFAVRPGKPQMAVVSQKSGIYKVIYEGSGAARVSLRILDEAGRAVYAETIRKTEGFIRPVNFAGMNPGLYTVEIVDEYGRQAQTIRHARNHAVDQLHLARLDEAGKFLLASALEQPGVSVKIYDGAERMVYDQTIDMTENFALVYNLKDVKGAPTFEITDRSGNKRVVKY